MKNKEYLTWVDFYMEFADKLLPYAADRQTLIEKVKAVLPNNSYMMIDNKISVKTLDLDCEFSEIATQLNTIADDFMKC